MPFYIRDTPVGVRFLQKITDICCPRLHFNRDLCYRSSVLFLTYIAYMCYHLSRKPISVVKTVLHQNCSKLTPPDGTNIGENSTWCDWAPFDGSDADASTLLGTLDSAFLFAYALAMFASGFVAERVNLRYFLAIGMLVSGIASYLIGVAKSYDIHSFSYFVFAQVLGGIFQTTGWPGVVTVVSNWFGKGKRGLIFGIWNSHTSIGNILGSLIAAEYVETDWSLSFIYPGLIIGVAGFLLFLFLVVNPGDVGCTMPDQENTTRRTYRRLEDAVANRSDQSSPTSPLLPPIPTTVNLLPGGSTASSLTPSTQHNMIPAESDTDDTEILIGEYEVQRRAMNESSHLLDRGRGNGQRWGGGPDGDKSGEERAAIGFIGACKIPGVIEFSLSLFFSKLVSYTFLYWLPLFLNASTTMGASLSADLSTLFDVGGIIGAIAAGAISDYSGMSATTCVTMLAAAAPMMFIYQHFCGISIAVNMFLLVIVGILVNGPYALITTAVSAELGTHSSLEGNAKALATVTAIIDGTGSIGAAVGPLFAGYISSYGWHNVFYMLMASDALALLLLVRLCKQELTRYKQRRRELRSE